jgi:multidrug resistance efflux pump
MQSLAFLWFELQMTQQYLRERTFGPAESPANSANLNTPIGAGTLRRASVKRKRSKVGYWGATEQKIGIMNFRPDQRNVLPDTFSPVRSHRFQTAKKLMLLKENTIPRNQVAPRPSASKANRADKPTNGPRRRILVIGAVIGVFGLFFGIRYFLYASTHDAYVTGYTHQISSRITGTVQEVLVDDNWHVTAGQPLLKLDPRDYQVALEKDRASYLQAQAQLLQASAQIPLAEAQLAQSQAQADASKANSDYLQRTFKRNSELFYQGRGVISKQDLDTAQSQAETSVATYKANLAAVNVAEENLKVARAQEGAARAQTEAALAQVKNSELQLSYCTIVAPISGRIAQKTVQTGNRVSVGQALMAVVEDNVWILANVKETQLERIRVGQPVEIKGAMLFRWRESLLRLLAQVALHLESDEAQLEILDPVFGQDDEFAASLLDPLVEWITIFGIRDAKEISVRAVPLLQSCLIRTLQHHSWEYARHTDGRLHGSEIRELIRHFLFVSVEADGAARFANSDWREVEAILPIVDRLVRDVGDVSDLMSVFLTLCERAIDSYPVPLFVEQVTVVLNRSERTPIGWRGTAIPGRIARLVHAFAERSQPLPVQLAQSMLRIPDRLIDMGDRRSAALQTSEIFKNVRV